MLECQAAGGAEKRSAEPAIKPSAAGPSEEVFAIARKALTDLATTSLEERMGEVFIARLREMDGKAKESLGRALKTASEPARRAQRVRPAAPSNVRQYKTRSTRPSRRKSASGSRLRRT